MYSMGPGNTGSRENLQVGAFGERLKRERERRKVTVEEIASATKIGSRMLRALEDEKFDLLPGGVFNKGFVRAYAKQVGMNEDEAVAAYVEAYRAAHPEASAPADPDAEARKIMEQRAHHLDQARVGKESIPWGKAAVAVLLLALGMAVWGPLRHHEKTHPVAAATAQKPATKPSAEPSESKSSEETVPAPTIQPAVEVATVPAPRAAAAISTPLAPGTFRVLIRAREDSWIQITADGKQVLQDTLSADSQKSVGARSEVIVKAGNVGALDFWFNGQKLPPQGDLDQVKTITFDASGLVAPSAQVEPVATTVER